MQSPGTNQIAYYSMNSNMTRKNAFRNKSSPKVIWEECGPPLTAENALAHFVCYQLRNAHYRRVQSLSRGQATSTQQGYMRPIMPNINLQADYFLLIISECTLIASKKSIRSLTYTESLVLLVILVQTYRISTR